MGNESDYLLYYLSEVVDHLLTVYESVNKEWALCDETDHSRDILMGKILAYYDALTTLRLQAELFDISLSDIHLDKDLPLPLCKK